MTFVDILRQMLEDALFTQDISSAGGDSPKVNYLRSVDINPGDYDEIFRNEIRTIAKEVMEKEGAGGTGKKTPTGLAPMAADKAQLTKLLEGALGGPSKARDAIQFLINPKMAIKGLLTKAGGPAAIAAVISVIVLALLIKELVRKGSVYDRTFKNLVFTQNEVLRVRQQQQQILVGFDEHSALGSQLITTTVAGTTDPRDSFNTYDLINRDNALIEDMFSIRTDYGI